MTDDGSDKPSSGETTTTNTNEPCEDVHVYLSPSDIRYLPCEGADHPVTPGESLQAGDLNADNCCLKVVKKEGVYFSVDNTRLGVLKRLHGEGRCSSVKVLQVPLDTMSSDVQDAMLHLPSSPARQKGRRHGKGPLKLLNFIHRERREIPVDDQVSVDESDTSCHDTGGENDLSGDFRDSSGVVSTDDDTEEENEATM